MWLDWGGGHISYQQGRAMNEAHPYALIGNTICSQVIFSTCRSLGLAGWLEAIQSR
jgi:hypothetical protein